jgi:hypothetical protein
MASPQGWRQPARNFAVQIGRGLRHLSGDQPLKRAGGWQHDTPLAQPVLGACHEFVGGPALDGTRAQPVAQIGRDVTIEVPDTEMTTDAQRLRPFRLRTARPIEEQNRRQAELAGQMVDDLDGRVPVVIEKVAMGAQHAELQGETAMMVRAAALGDHRQVRRRQAPVLCQFVLARIGRRRHPSPGLRGCG